MDKFEETARVIIDSIDFAQPGTAFQRLEQKIAGALRAAVVCERESCAQIAQDNWGSQKTTGANHSIGVIDASNRIAATIRNRGKSE